MGLDTKAQFIGLVTASGEAAAAQGALRIADNVTLRKEGALVCRPSFASTALPYTYRAAFPYKGSLYYVATGNALYGPTHAHIPYPGNAAAAALRADVQAAKEARGNFYLATAEGVLKLTGTSDTALTQAGVTPTDAYIYTVSMSSPGTGTDLLTASQQVAYRVVYVLTDPNGVVIRGRPSGAVGAIATGVQSPYVQVYANTGPGAPYKRQIELYRTHVFPTSAQVDDEYQLVKTFDLPTTGSTFSITFVDQIPDANRGKTLYTSPSRGGGEAANDRPPACACIERYRGSVFYGNTAGPHRVVISYTPSTTNLVGSAIGIGVRQTTGTTSNGSTSITAVANTTGLQVGMTVWTQASGGSMGRITAIAGTTVTTSAAATAAQTAQTVWFQDSIVVDSASALLGVGPNAGVAGLTTVATTSAGLAWGSPLKTTYTAYEITPPTAGYGQTVVFERITRGGAPFQVRATHGDAMSPAVPLANAGAGLLSEADVIPNGLAWSEPDEPEHVPPKNFARVGDHGKAILGLVATRDRLLVFKEDGLYMLTGGTAKNFSIYPLDTTCICILPGSIRRLKNTVFVLTNLGLVAVDENGGVTVVSRPIQTDIAPIVQQIRAAAKASSLYLMPGLSGTTGAGDDAAGEYWLALGSTTPSFGGQVLVYSMPREGFTTYSFGASTPVALATDGEGQPLALTSNALLSPTTTQGAVVARISPRAFSDPALVGKLWTHIVVGLSQLTGTSSSSIAATFSSSEAMVASSITELLEGPISGPTMVAPLGTLLRHPVPRAMARAFMLFVEVVITTSNGTFTVELLGAESRENVSNKRPTHGTGVT